MPSKPTYLIPRLPEALTYPMSLFLSRAGAPARTTRSSQTRGASPPTGRTEDQAAQK